MAAMTTDRFFRIDDEQRRKGFNRYDGGVCKDSVIACRAAWSVGEGVGAAGVEAEEPPL